MKQKKEYWQRHQIVVTLVHWLTFEQVPCKPIYPGYLTDPKKVFVASKKWLNGCSYTFMEVMSHSGNDGQGLIFPVSSHTIHQKIACHFKLPKYQLYLRVNHCHTNQSPITACPFLLVMRIEGRLLTRLSIYFEVLINCGWKIQRPYSRGGC